MKIENKNKLKCVLLKKLYYSLYNKLYISLINSTHVFVYNVYKCKYEHFIFFLETNISSINMHVM